MTGTEIYKRTATYEREAQKIRLHAPEWKLLLAFDGQRSLAEVALTADVTFADALPTTARFLDRLWIEEQPITLDQYLKRTGAAHVSGIGAAIPPAVVLHEPKPETASPASPPPLTPPETTPVKPATGPLPPARSASAAPTTGPAVTPSAGPVSQTLPKGAMRLSAVIDHIISLAGNNPLGQLLAYRVFLRVPPELLQDEDIGSVHLTNDHHLARTEALQQAIANAVLDIVKRPLPKSVFVAA